MSEQETIRVNFGKPIPLFPLQGLVLLPQQVAPLHIFEERYRQMVSRGLDGAGLIALGLFDGDEWKSEYDGTPPVRAYVCICQIVQHETLPDGRFNILVQGVCRAKIAEHIPPAGERLYREVLCEPVGVDEFGLENDELVELRSWLETELTDGPLRHLRLADQVLEYVRNDSVPTSAVLELVGFAVVSGDNERYRLLAEGDPVRRGRLVRGSLESLDRLLRLAEEQKPEEWPKGLSWN